MNSNNYNCLVKLASTPLLTKLAMPFVPGVTSTAMGHTAPPAIRPSTLPKPETYPAVNPATGGTRIMHKGRPLGPVSSDHSFRQGPLPITPYSSGKIPITSMEAAERLADRVDMASYFNNYKKLENALNLDAMFKKLHRINLKRRANGLPDYTPNAMDIYAPNALSKRDYANAEYQIQEDNHLSTIAHEAARRGTPYNPAELSALKGLSYKLSWQIDPPTHMGLTLPEGHTPDIIGAEANRLNMPK